MVSLPPSRLAHLWKLSDRSLSQCRRCFASSSTCRDEQGETFDAHAADLRRRKRRTDEKRRQHGATFIDHMIVTVRGGTGGSGTASFIPTKSTALGPPSGGNGGPGGSIFFTTSPHLTSLSSLTKRLRGAPGGNGSGSFKHGRRGVDTVIALPVGTVVKELHREGEEERFARDEAGGGEVEMRRRRRERWFIKHPTGEVAEDDYADAEAVLYREGRIPSTRTLQAYTSGLPAPHPTEPPIELDISHPLTAPILISPGGLGGLGNPHFFSSSNPHRPPRIASRGFSPPTITLSLELKLLADVGLVGFPNAGKSTILRGLTGRRAEIAGYSFTTLNPQVGVVRVMDDGTWKGGVGEGEVIEETWKERRDQDQSKSMGEFDSPLPSSSLSGGVEKLRFTISDNPGLLPLASQNVGLGHSFLRSIERSLALVYVLDMTRPSPASDLEVLRGELEAYKPGLGGKGRLVVVNKGDEVEEGVGRGRLEELREKVREMAEEGGEGKGREMEVKVISAKFGLGLEGVVESLGRFVVEAREEMKELEEEEGDE